MKTPEILNIFLLFAGIASTVLSVISLFIKVKEAKKIIVTRKDTGRSVVVSKKLNTKEIHELAELLK